MAKSFICRLGLAQISCNPAYADELVACIQEPDFPAENSKVGLFTVAGIEEIVDLRRRITDQYVSHLNRKLESVIRFASNERVELLVFPEYSIPPESLPLCQALSEELQIALVAGSHVMTISQSAQQIYRDLKLKFEEDSKPTEGRVRQAACIVFVPGTDPVAFVKYVTSKWETCLVKGAPVFHTFRMPTKSGQIEVQVLICIEALSEKQAKEKHNIPRLITIAAFTPKVEPFHDEGRRALLQGKCTLFANVAEFGGSKAFARADTTNLWFTEKDGSDVIPRGSEGLLILEADLEKQFEVRQLAKEHTSVSDVRVYPVLYTLDSAESQQYADIIEVSRSTEVTLQEISTQISPFTNLSPKVFPRLLQEKLQHFTGHVVPAGTVSSQEAIRWITPIEIRDISSTDGLRWELCNQAAEVVNKLIVSGKYVHKTKELVEVYAHLIEKRNNLTESIQPRQKATAVGDQLELRSRPLAAESPFIDRDAVFDRIRQFFAQQENSGFVLGGMRGIGKTALVQEAFRQAIPLRRRIWLQLTDGISYQRLIAELASGCNLTLPENLDLSSPRMQAEIEGRILSYIGKGPGVVVVLDEFQFLLNAAAEVDDPSIRKFLLGVLEAAQKGRSKFFFISHIFPKLGPQFESCCASYALHGLSSHDTQRLLTQWIQFGREDLALHLARPSEKLISILAGHPLATKVAARLCADHPSADIAEEFSIFKQLRDTIVAFILERLTLSRDEEDLLSFASIFRVPAPREVFLHWRKEDSTYLLDSLAGHYLIETSDRGYQLHPLVRSFFYNNLSSTEARKFHKIAGKFYLQEFERIRRTSKQVVPEYFGETVHHFLVAGDIQKVREFSFYREELRPVALEHYRRGEHETALKDYKVLLELDNNDLDAHFHLALIYARKDRWGDAEFHFGKAMELKPRAYWILQAYGAAKMRARKFAEGEDLLLQAEKINPNHSPTLVELGRFRERLGDSVSADEYYRRAIDADTNNSLAYYRYGKFLYRAGDIAGAFEMAKAALATNPTNKQNKDLIRELKERLRNAS